jgi:excisionase family DNA binding protein
MPVLKDYVKVSEAAKILRIHPGTVKRLCREHRLSAYKVHNGWLIHIDEIQSPLS